MHPHTCVCPLYLGITIALFILLMRPSQWDPLHTQELLFWFSLRLSFRFQTGSREYHKVILAAWF